MTEFEAPPLLNFGRQVLRNGVALLALSGEIAHRVNLTIQRGWSQVFLIASGISPGMEDAEGYSPETEGAVCANCGFNDLGMAGCAPTLDDVEGEGADALLHVRVTADEIDVVSAT